MNRRTARRKNTAEAFEVLYRLARERESSAGNGAESVRNPSRPRGAFVGGDDSASDAGPAPGRGGPGSGASGSGGPGSVARGRGGTPALGRERTRRSAGGSPAPAGDRSGGPAGVPALRRARPVRYSHRPPLLGPPPGFDGERANRPRAVGFVHRPNQRPERVHSRGDLGEGSAWRRVPPGSQWGEWLERPRAPGARARDGRGAEGAEGARADGIDRVIDDHAPGDDAGAQEVAGVEAVRPRFGSDRTALLGADDALFPGPLDAPPARGDRETSRWTRTSQAPEPVFAGVREVDDPPAEPARARGQVGPRSRGDDGGSGDGAGDGDRRGREPPTATRHAAREEAEVREDESGTERAAGAPAPVRAPAGGERGERPGTTTSPPSLSGAAGDPPSPPAEKRPGPTAAAAAPRGLRALAERLLGYEISALLERRLELRGATVVAIGMVLVVVSFLLAAWLSLPSAEDLERQRLQAIVQGGDAFAGDPLGEGPVGRHAGADSTDGSGSAAGSAGEIERSPLAFADGGGQRVPLPPRLPYWSPEGTIRGGEPFGADGGAEPTPADPGPPAAPSPPIAGGGGIARPEEAAPAAGTADPAASDPEVASMPLGFAEQLARATEPYWLVQVRARADEAEADEIAAYFEEHLGYGCHREAGGDRPGLYNLFLNRMFASKEEADAVCADVREIATRQRFKRGYFLDSLPIRRKP